MHRLLIRRSSRFLAAVLACLLAAAWAASWVRAVHYAWDRFELVLSNGCVLAFHSDVRYGLYSWKSGPPAWPFATGRIVKSRWLPAAFSYVSRTGVQWRVGILPLWLPVLALVVVARRLGGRLGRSVRRAAEGEYDEESSGGGPEIHDHDGA